MLPLASRLALVGFGVIARLPKGHFMRKTLKVEYLNLISNARMALHDVADY
jgi:hypothetical protein